MLRIAGSGGMGLVYQVRHLQWGIDLAVKRPHAARWGAAPRTERFIAEAEAWVSLGLHPHVCTCHYVRVVDAVPCAFAEYVGGGSVRDWISDGRLYEGTDAEGLARVLDVSIQTAWGLAHAHNRGLVHQDVKPANVLLEIEPDGTPTAKVTDFGLARARARAGAWAQEAPGGPAGSDSDSGRGADGSVTVQGWTSQYASPEQVDRKGARRVDARSDVYSFAVSVLEMFTGGLTWMFGPGAGEALSDRLARGGWQVEMPGEVARLLGRCLRRDPADRPAAMAGVAAELLELYPAATGRPYPDRLPAPAEPRADELNNKALSLLDLGRPQEAEEAFAQALSVDPLHLDATNNAALYRWRHGAVTNDDMLAVFHNYAEPNRWRPGAVTDEDVLAALEHVRGAGDDPARARRLIAAVHLERGDLDSARELPAGPSDQQHRDARCLGVHPIDAVLCATPDGARALAVGPGSSLCLWDVRTGRRLRELKGAYDTGAVVLGGDGRFLAAAAGAGREARIWDLSDGRCLCTLDTGPSPSLVAVSTEGVTAVAADGEDGRIAVVDLRARRIRHTLRTPAGLRRIALSGDGRWMITVSLGGQSPLSLRVWDLDDGACVLATGVSYQNLEAIDLSPRAGLMVLVYTHAVDVRDLWTGARTRTLPGHFGGTTDVSLDPDARLLVTAHADGAIRYRLMDTGRCLRTYRGHDGPVTEVHLNAETGHVVSVGADSTIRTWSTPPDSGNAPAPFQLSVPRRQADLDRLSNVASALIDAAGQAEQAGRVPEALALLNRARTVPSHERSPRLREAVRHLGAVAEHVALRATWSACVVRDPNAREVAVSADGRIGVWTDEVHGLTVWDMAADARIREIIPNAYFPHSPALSPDATLVMAAVDDGVRVWSARAGELIRSLTAFAHAGFTADGREAVLIDGGVSVWELDGDRLRRVGGGRGLERLRGRPSLGPDDRLAAVTEDGAARIWSLTTGAEVAALRTPAVRLGSVALSGDGQSALTVDRGGEQLIRLWNIPAGECVRELPTSSTTHTSPPSIRFAPNAKRFAFTGGSDAVIRIWDLTAGSQVGELAGHGSTITDFAVAAGGHHVISAGLDGTVRLWELDWELAAPRAPR